MDLLSRTGVLGWEIGTTGVSQPGQINIFVVVVILGFGPDMDSSCPYCRDQYQRTSCICWRQPQARTLNRVACSHGLDIIPRVLLLALWLPHCNQEWGLQGGPGQGNLLRPCVHVPHCSLSSQSCKDNAQVLCISESKSICRPWAQFSSHCWIHAEIASWWELSQINSPPTYSDGGRQTENWGNASWGYTIKERNSSLVTVDMVWELTSDTLLIPRPWLKDLCLSFALFKLLRRRFEMTHIVDPTKAFSFVLEVLLNSSSPERVFSVLADEVSFVLDSYYSSLPTSNFGRLLPVLNIIISLSIIIWCLFGCVISHRYSMHHPRQIFCIPYL